MSPKRGQPGPTNLTQTISCIFGCEPSLSQLSHLSSLRFLLLTLLDLCGACPGRPISALLTSAEVENLTGAGTFLLARLSAVSVILK